MTRREILYAVVFLALLAVYLTWPQALHMTDHVVRHDDPYFSIWRLAWVAHALRTSPHHLYDANIFYPEPRTLAYSDATFLEAAIGAPMIWAGMSPVTVSNLLLLAGIAGSGIGMLVLAQHLTANSRAALVAAAAFTLLPYRVEHVMHLELQWAMWIPMGLWALHRTVETRSYRWGALTGIFVWLQLLSCVYYGIFLALALAVLGLLLVSVDRRGIVRIAAAAAVGALIAAPIAYLYARPYLQNARTLGARPAEEVARFSAVPLSYLSAPPGNWIWSATAGPFTGNELHLFPGLIFLTLAVLAVKSPKRRTAAVYAAVCLFGVVMSFGPHAPLYAWLRDHLFLLRGLRAAARFSIVAFCALSILAALGYAWLEARLAPRIGAPAVMIACLVALGLEAGSAPVNLAALPRRVPDIYVMLRSMPAGPVAEFPAADPGSLPGYDPYYMFWSTTHWRPLVNGYSGYLSQAYIARLEKLRGFPAPEVIRALQEFGVRWVVVHEASYPSKELPKVLLAIAQTPALKPIGSYRDVDGRAQLFELRGSVPPSAHTRSRIPPSD